MTAGADQAIPSEDSAGLALRDFEGRIGTVFRIQTEFGEQELVLHSAKEIPGSPRPEGGFQLEFTGPFEPRLHQGIYGFPIDGALHEIFIVAIGVNPEQRLRYEAVFF